MNRNFKVVFSKARGALMVVNEATSSVQAKGTKTVIAAAVAALSLGAGVASADPATGMVTSGTATVEGSFTITNDASAAGGLSADKVTVEKDGQEVEVKDWSKQTLAESDKLSITLKGGELATTFDDKASKDLTVALGNVKGAGTISMTATKGAEGKAYGQALTVDTLALSEGDLNFSASGTGAKTGGISITTADAGAITLGTKEDKPVGSSVPTTAAKAANITVNDAALAVTLTASKADFDYNAGTVTNAGTLTLAATKGDTSGGVVTLGKDVSFANSGTVAIKGDKVQLDASYDVTSEANKSGYLEVKSTAASDGTITVGGTLTADTIKLGEKTADDAKGNRQEKNQIVLDAETTTVAKDGKLDVKNTLTLEKNLTVQGIVNTAATDVKVIGSGDQATNNTVKVTVDASGSAYAGSASLGKVTVGAGTDQAANSLTVSVTDGAFAQADSLDIAAEVKDKDDATTTKNTAGKFVLASGIFNAGTLTNGGSVSIGDSGVATLTVSGTSVNKGDVIFNATNKSALVIAADSTFSNEGNLGDADGTNSDITVAGTLTNVYKAAFGTDAGITGKINAATVNVTEGGVVNTALDNYKVTTTNVAGTFATDLNAKLKDDGTLDTSATKGFNTLKLTTQQFVLNGGSITDRAETPADIKDFYIADSGALTLGSDKELGTVVLDNADAADEGLTVKKGAVTVADLTVKKGTVVINGDGSSLAIDALTTKETDSPIDICQGTLSTTLAGIGLKIADKDIVAKDVTVADGTIKIAQNGVWNLDLGENAVIGSAGLGTIKGLVATDELKGLIDIGSAAVEVTGLDLTKETTYKQIFDAGLLGVKTDALSQATITEVKTIGQTGDFGSLKLDSSAKDTLVVTAGTLTLNGSGAVVSYEKTKDNWVEANVSLGDKAGLVTTGEKATIGSIAKDTGASKTFVEVASNSLEVKGNIDVDELYVGNDEGTASFLTVTKVGDASTVKTGEFEIETGAAFVAADADVTLTSDKTVNFDDRSEADVNYVAGSAEAKNLTVTTGDLLVTGNLKVTDTLIGRVIVGTDKSAGSLVVNNLKGTVFADPAWVDGKSEAASTVLVKALATEGSVEAGRNSVVTVGGEKAFTADEVQALTGFTLAETPTADNETTGVKAVKSIDTYTVNSVVVLGGDKTTVMNGTIVASNSEQPSAAPYQVSIDRNSMLVVDALKLDTTGETALFAQRTNLADGSILFIDNAANGQKFLLSKANGTSYSADAVFEGNLLMEESYNKDSNTLSIGMTDKSEVVDKLGDVAGLDAIYGMYEKGENVGNTNAQFFRDLMSSQTSSAYDKTTGEWNFQTIRTTLNDVAAIGATTGAQAVTMDAVNQMADTVAARTSILTQRAQGVNVWVDVNGGRFEGKKVMDGAGYSSDIYAGTLGADYQFANGAVLGAALTIGTADTDSKGTTAKTSMDSDLVGFSVYGSKTFADIWNVAGDIGYLQASNDVTESGYGFGDFSEDVNAFTLGVRGEVLTKAGSVNIVPHLGLRYTRLSTDGFTAGFNTEIDDQNIFQMPVGVTVSADFETSGWTIAPKFDLSVVPTFGDKDADLKLGITGVSASDDLSVRVIDSNPVQATLGVSATNGAWGFGLNYKLGVGSDDRMNNSFNANVRYAF